MAEKHNSDLRVIFPKGAQQRFIERAQEKVSVSDLSRMCGYSERTIRDWRRERFSIPLSSLQKICGALQLLPGSRYTTRSFRDHLKQAAKLGGRVMFEKYGRIGNDPEQRKRRWEEWWNREGRRQSHPIIGVTKPIKRPSPSEELAEFIGIMIGDGGTSDAQLTITLHSEDDRAYGVYVASLITRLFDVPVSVRPRSDCKATNYVISRREMVNFCVDKLGLVKGNKITQQVDVPLWIKEEQRFIIACVRGLIDTDGSIFTHSYVAKGKMYHYKKISFSSRSLPLLQSMYTFLNDLNIRARMATYEVRLDSIASVKRYMKIVGTRNPKHLKRYRE